MKRFIVVIIVYLGCSFFSYAQKSKVIAIFQLIESGKYQEAKKAVEEAISDDKTWRWPRTWYARGLLCQTAYQKGIEDKSKDKKKYQLYPDQIYVAIDSYEKARSLDKRGRLDEQLAPKYILLANTFKKLGEKHYNDKDYKEAYRAFEQALQINQSPILSVLLDTNLMYNTALAAFESEEWEKATEYLNWLNQENYSSNVPHLLSKIYLEKEDTISAENVLREGIEQYREHEDLVLLLVDLLYQQDAYAETLAVLDNASSRNPSNYIYPYTKGLIYQKTDQYEKAIETYQEALNLAPDEIKILSNMGTCYYNIGVEIERNARTITNNSAFLAEKEKSAESFETAVAWFEKAYEKDPDNQYAINKLYQLYRVLGLSDKMKSVEGGMD